MMTNDFLGNEFGVHTPLEHSAPATWWTYIQKTSKQGLGICMSAMRYSTYIVLGVLYMYVFSWLNSAYDASSEALSAQVLVGVSEIQGQVGYMTDVIADEAIRVLSVVHW